MEKNLFVVEEFKDDVQENTVNDNVIEHPYGNPANDSSDDPVVEEIAVNLVHGPCPLHVLQYANKPKKLGRRLIDHPPVKEVRYKEKSSLLEMDIPLNTEYFFNTDRAKEEWNDVEVQTLRGVGVQNDGQYVGLMHDGELYLLPVESVAQMRPYFKYIDQSHQQQQRRQDDMSARTGSSGSNGTAPKAQVVTMSVKSSSEANQNRLGGSLLAHRIAEDEQSQEFAWKEDTIDSFMAEIITEEAREPLKPLEDATDYLKKLI
ncbi:HBR449Cp [Eremothecium sinecaudum]|uniref:HBR449Cp n=1 Tax=Eremothecium sinecaudum TaxID=45286 RepID=A0A120K1G2_9SACH|nr:HBR449Cp [Eremothecium sinecaudum]AMD19350.1 HBR449Cp [Eremothecium sinecaudum]